MILGMRTSVSTLAISPVVSQNFLTNTTVPSWLDNSGTTGNRMLYDSTGKLTWAPNNLLTYSNDFTNAAWSKGTATVSSGVSDPFGGTSATTITATAGFGFVQQIKATAAATTLNTVWLRRRTGTGPVYLSKPDNTATAVTLTGSWQQFYITGAPLTGSSYLTVSIQTNGDAIDIYGATASAVTYETAPRPGDQVITTTAAYYGPRFDYDPSTLAAKGLLIEESRANLVTYSADFGTSYTLGGLLAFGSGSTLNAAVAPDGVALADLITEDTTNGFHRIYKLISPTTANTAYSYSLYAKQASGSRLLFINLTAGSDTLYAYVNLSSGLVTNSGATGTGSLSSATVDSVGNGYYRIKIVGIVSTTATGFYTQLVLSNVNTGSSMPSYVGDGVSGVYLWGAQLEAGSFATSYIPTVAASVTRVADNVKWTSAAFSSYWSGSQGTIVAQVNRPINVYGQRFLSVYDGSNNRFIDLNFSGGSGTQVDNFSNNTGGGTLLLTTGITAGLARVAFGYALNNFGGSVNGSNVASDTSISLTVTPIAFALGGYTAGSNTLNGHIQSFAYYNQRLPDATLQSKSVVDAPL